MIDFRQITNEGSESVMKRRPFNLACIAATGIVIAVLGPVQSATPQVSSAWHDGKFQVDIPGVVGRSDIVLGRPNAEAGQAMPLGNGTLGVAVWSADGLTAQLNRADTMPDRLSLGQVVIPGLSALTTAKDYTGRLSLYHGEFFEQGGGRIHTDRLAIR